MNFFRRRPLALAGFLFLGSSLAAFFLGGMYKLLIAGAVLIPLAVFSAYVYLSHREYLKKNILRLALILVPVTVSMLSSFLYFDFYFDRTEADYAGKPCVIEATVTERSGGAFGVSYELIATRINGEPVNLPIRLRMDGACPAREGDSLTFTAVPQTLRAFADNQTALCSYISDGFLLGVTVDGEQTADVRVIESGENPDGLNFLARVGLSVSDVRNRLSLYLSDAVGGDAGELASALLLGDKSRVSESVTRDFHRTGASHLLALSGLHVVLLSGMAEWVLRRLRMPKRPRVILLGILILFYLALVGFPPSAVRAVFMLLFTYLSYLFAGDHDTPTALFSACSLVLLLSPASVCDLSFWMSFAATFGIVSLYVPFEHAFRERFRKRVKRGKHPVRAAFLRFGKGVVSSLAVSVSACIAVSTVLWVFSEEMPLLSPLITLLLTPAVTVSLVLAVFCLLFARIPLLCAFFPDLLHVVGEYMLHVTSRLAKIPDTTVPLTHPATPYVLILMTGALVVMLFLRFRHKWVVVLPPVAAALTIAVCLGVSSAAARDRVLFTYLQMGSDSEQLVFTGNDGGVIVDFSDGYASRFRQSAKTVSRAGCPEIRAVVLTHYHQAHTSGVTALMESSYVRELWLPYPGTERDYAVMNRLVRDAERAGVAVRLYRDGETLTVFGELRLNISGAYIKRSAQKTFVLTLTGEKTSLTYLGGAVQESELSAVAEAAVGTSDVTVFGVHGPGTGDIVFHGGDALRRAGTILFANDAVLSRVCFDPDTAPEAGNGILLKNPRYFQAILPVGGHQDD